MLLSAWIPDVAAKKSEKQDEGYVHLKDISYCQPGETDSYRLERCRLDVYYPEKTEGFATLVWFTEAGWRAAPKN